MWPTIGVSSSSELELITRPPAQTAVGAGGLPGGLDVESDRTGHRTIRCLLLLMGNQGARVGSRRDCTWILGLSGFRVITVESDDDTPQGRS